MFVCLFNCLSSCFFVFICNFIFNIMFQIQTCIYWKQIGLNIKFILKKRITKTAYRPIMLAVMAEWWDRPSCCQGNSTRAVSSLEKKKKRKLEKQNNKFQTFWSKRPKHKKMNYYSKSVKTNMQNNYTMYTYNI